TRFSRDWSSDVCSSDLVARHDAADAWQEAERRFPADREGQIMHELAMKTSDSQWHKQLSADAAASSRNGSGNAEDGAVRSPYWQIGRASCRERVWMSVG